MLEAGRTPETGVFLTAALFAVLLASVPVIYLVRWRQHARPETAGLAFLTGSAIVLLAIYLYWVSWYVFFPADFLIWTEGDFVNDILKIATRYPIYSPQINNNSFFYVPGAQFLTGLLAGIVGESGSIPALRVIQVVYTAGAAFMAVLCCRQILRLAWPEHQPRNAALWHGFWYAVLFLIATNSITNPFTHNLHGDALAQLAALIGYYLMLRYCETKSLRTLIGMALFAPCGFLIRQSLLAWGGFFAVFLAIWDRRWVRVSGFVLLWLGALGIVLGACYALWSRPFFYWTFYVLGRHGVSPLRAFQHALVAWPYFAIGLLGGAGVLRPGGPPQTRALTGAWFLWLCILATETYTSGIAWMSNHMGPGSLIAGVWFLAGLAMVWESANQTWLRSAALTAAVAAFFSGLAVVRIPMQAIPDDAYRYVRDIERQFRGIAPEKVLLDAGSWVYMKDRIVMGDRAPGIGERGFTETGDFSGILERIGQKRYAKILVRGLHDRDFVYDYYLWPKPSGIRQALLDNYRETATIPPVEESPYARRWAEDPYYFGAVSVLEPKPDRQGN